MRIAVVFGKGIDGCGVTKGIVEMQKWGDRSREAVVDVFSMRERTFARENAHVWQRPPIHFLPTDCAEVAGRLNDYDVVVLNSYPSAKHSHASILSFYRDLVCRLERPIVVGMMHEIKQMNIDSIPLILPILNRCDVVFNFSEKTWFSREFSRIMPWKGLGTRTKRFKLWLDCDDYLPYVTPFDDRRRLLTYYGRWTSMKDPRRLIDLHPIFMSRDPDFRVVLHGLEKSIGCKVDILECPGVRYKYTWDGDWNFPGDVIPVYGQCSHHDGMTRLSESAFGASFFFLPKEPENYGDRMEYTQIEICATGCVPVFDKHYGDNNVTDDGTPFSSVDHLAIWSDRDDLEGTADRILEVESSRSEKEAYRESAMAFARREFSSESVLPAMFDSVVRVGKDNARPDDSGLLEHFFGTTRAGEDFEQMMRDGHVPGLGFRQAWDGHLARFDKKARVPMHEYSSRASQSASLDSFFS